MTLATRVLGQGAGTVTALLGPTNTGKTHRAIERMLTHRTGMIGLPLRLLAREVYDRVRAARGDEQVALVTGEEKRIPASPRYFVCTVEAMPVDRVVSFLAIDEVQLAADRTRGHVFTDRILHARGLNETWLMGSDTIAPLLRQLVPDVAVEGAPRMSRLSWGGHRKLTALPRRSAVVAFSAERVYTLAERIRAKRGGAAVVLGALSPRARNAQVALFQSGEVPWLVATDAIGMGLNLDLDHVAFAELEKYDGRGHRGLDAAEVAQIAGRAGRYIRDGTFGTTDAVDGLPDALVEAVENHTFPPIERLYWRNPSIDLDSVDGLLRSLAVRPPHEALVRMRDAEDHQALEQLAVRDDVRARLGRAGAGLLWDVCQVPDFRKTLTGSHVDLLAGLFVALADRGRLDADAVGRRVDALDDVSGDLDALMTRIAWVRTWSFVTHRRDWVDDPTAWQDRCRAIEDRLSDALHAALTRRFVDRRAMVVLADAPADREGVDPDGTVRIDGQVVGRLDGAVFLEDAAISRDKALARAARKVAAEQVAVRLDALPDGLELDGDRVRLRGGEIARLTRGTDALFPLVRLRRVDLAEPDARSRAEVAVRTFVDAELLAIRDALSVDGAPSAAARAVAFAVRAGLGTARRDDVPQVDALGEADRRWLASRGIRLGRRSLYASGLLGDRAVAHRALLWAVWRDRPVPSVPAGGRVSVPADPAVPWTSLGYEALGPLAVRVDVAEKVAARLREAARSGGRVPPEIASWAGCPADTAPKMAVALGFRVAADGSLQR